MGSFCPVAGTRNPHRDCNFAERVVETVPKSLRHSCRSELTRQGISLPYDRYSYGARLPGLRRKASPCGYPLPLTFRHRAGVSVYTAPCAAWHTPVFLLNSRLGRFSATQESFDVLYTSLSIPSYEVTVSLCRVPWPGFTRSPEAARLAHLCRFTVRTSWRSPQSFSRLSTPQKLALPCGAAFPSGLGHFGCGLPPWTVIHKTASASFQCPSVVRHDKTGREFQPVIHRLRLWGLTLGSASPCADCHGAGNLGLTVCRVFTRICAYSIRHPHFWSLQDNVCHGPFTAPRTLPYPCCKATRPS